MSYMDEVEETPGFYPDDEPDDNEWDWARRMAVQEYSHYLGEGEIDDELMDEAREALGIEPYDWREHLEEYVGEADGEDELVEYVPVMDEHEGQMVLGFADPDNPDDCLFPGEGPGGWDLDDDELF